MGGEWDVRIEERADREFGKLPRQAKNECADLIEALAEDPYQRNAVALRRNNDFFRIYFGGKKYRLIYRVVRSQRIVKVVRIRPRGTAYLGLPDS